MKKWWIPLIGVVIVSLMLPRLVQNHLPANTFYPYGGKIVVIDPGHGGQDGGVVGKSGSVEATLNLQVSFKLRDYLKQLGITVVMTRETEEGLCESGRPWSKHRDMKLRGDIAKNANAHLLISVHMNSFPSSVVFGSQVFYAKGSESGHTFATLMQNQLKVFQPNNKRIEKAEDFYMLMQTTCPAILVECGFVSNRTEETQLMDDSYQTQLAWHLMFAISQYIDQTKTT